MKKIYLLCVLIQLGFFIQAFSQTKRVDLNSDIEESSTSIQNIQDLIDVTTFPNPASKTLTFIFSGVDLSDVVVEIFELTGQPVLTMMPDNDHSTVDVSGFKEGLYFYKVVVKGLTIKTEKFIVLKK